jgi:hypothetical protein
LTTSKEDLFSRILGTLRDLFLSEEFLEASLSISLIWLATNFSVSEANSLAARMVFYA